MIDALLGKDLKVNIFDGSSKTAAALLKSDVRCTFGLKNPGYIFTKARFCENTLPTLIATAGVTSDQLKLIQAT